MSVNQQYGPQLVKGTPRKSSRPTRLITTWPARRYIIERLADGLTPRKVCSDSRGLIPVSQIHLVISAMASDYLRLPIERLRNWPKEAA